MSENLAAQQHIWSPPPEEILSGILAHIHFDSQGLIAAIAQDRRKNILMLAWMNRDSLTETLRSGRVCYYSRSRGKLWRKGETSGQVQYLLNADFDCDMDALLLTVEQKGVACHTGRRSCFYRGITPEGLTEHSQPEIAPEALYGTAGKQA